MPCHPPPLLQVDAGFVLRLAVVADADGISTVVAASLEHLAPWMQWATPEAADPEVQRSRLEADHPQDGDEYMYLMLSHGEMVGACGLHRRIGPRAIEIGYWLAPYALGRGFATKATQTLTHTAMELSDVDRVEIHCDQANARSAAVPRRLGYRLERVEPDEIAAPNEVGQSMIWVKP